MSLRFLLPGLLLIPLIGQAQFTARKTSKLMGSRFDLTIVAEDSLKALEYIDQALAEITRIEKLISSWDENSQTSAINRNAGIAPVVVDQELFDLIQRSLAISKLTDGAFDISYASMDRIWRFDGSMTGMPTAEQIRESVSRVGYENIVLDTEKHSVFLKEHGMKIGFGAIGKGYAADRAKQLLMDQGVPAGIINASGDMNTWGKQANGKDWTIAITNPLNKDHVFATLPMREGAVVTSGDYERFVSFNGVRYAHIINPKTGYPATGIISVTIFAKSAELADALATSVFVLGIEVGMDLIDQLPAVDVIIIGEDGKIHASRNIEIRPQ